MLEALKKEVNYGLTENGSAKCYSTLNKIYDLFALGGAYRSRSDNDVMKLFWDAYCQDSELALKCLFYLRDVRGGLGERRFFRTVIKKLADRDIEAIRRNIEYIPYFGRWDDLFSLFGTYAEHDALALIEKQLKLDVQSKTPSLLAKWLKSENTSSKESRELGKKVRISLGLTAKQYRKTLSILRKQIRIVEGLMSANDWEAIEFDKIPSKAGFQYRNAFARHDFERYNQFIFNKNKRVNGKDLYPYEIINQAVQYSPCGSLEKTKTERESINKYWHSLLNYIDKFNFDGLVVCDTSASMRNFGYGLGYGRSDTPINVAISLAMYCAEKAKGPFANHFISFSRNPKLVEVNGIDFVDKVKRIYNSNICENTNLEGVFRLLLDTAIKNKLSLSDLPKYIVIISDMEIDRGTVERFDKYKILSMMARMRTEWLAAGYKMPKLIYWNVAARNNTFLDDASNENVTYVSGASPTIFNQVVSGKTGYELCLEVLNSQRYEKIK